MYIRVPVPLHSFRRPLRSWNMSCVDSSGNGFVSVFLSMKARPLMSGNIDHLLSDLASQEI